MVSPSNRSNKAHTGKNLCPLVEAIVLARWQQGLSQRELAKESGVPRSTIARLELGLCDPLPSTFRRLATALEMDEDQAKDLLWHHEAAA